MSKTESMETETPLLSATELAAWLRISKPSLLRLVRAGMPHMMVGEMYRFERAAVVAWLEQRKNERAIVSTGTDEDQEGGAA